MSCIANEETIKKAMGYKYSLLKKLNDQRLNNIQLCDMKITGDDHEQIFHVHKCLIGSASDYFLAMFNSGMQESRSDSIQLKGVSSQGLKEVIDFIYSGELRLSLNNISDILRAVSHLQVKHALKLCEEYLIEETTCENCIDMLNLAELFSIYNVKNEVNRYILRNFEKLIQNEQFKRLSLEQMQQCLKSNKLKLYPEIRVFECCIEWLRNYMDNSDAINSIDQNEVSITYSLMQYVRFNTMKPEEFINIVTRNELIKSDQKCNSLVIEGYEYFALPNRQYCSSSPRNTIRNEPMMVCVNESMYILNSREEIWQYLCQSHATCKTLSQKFCVVNNFLYACGGYNEIFRETTNKCDRFDPRTGQWYQVASMNEKRQFFTLASCESCIVAVGGVYGNVGNFYATYPVISPIEVYSIEKDSWKSLNSAHIPILKWPGACIFTKPNQSNKPQEKYVFIVGGKLTDIGPYHYLSEKSYIVNLNDANDFEVCASPITTRFNPSVFHDANENKIILFGGEDDKYRLAPVIEIFDLETRQWSEVATIPVSLSYQCISSTNMVKSKIYYVIEEHDGPSSESYILKSAYFDIKTCQFEIPHQLPHPSTLASKWCSLIFPQEFLEKCLKNVEDLIDYSPYTYSHKNQPNSNDYLFSKRQIMLNTKNQKKYQNSNDELKLITNLNKIQHQNTVMLRQAASPEELRMISNLHSLQSIPALNNTNLMSLPSMINSLSLSNSSTISNLDFIVNKETASLPKNEEYSNSLFLSSVISNSDDDDLVNDAINNNNRLIHQSEIINNENPETINCIQENIEEARFCSPSNK